MGHKHTREQILAGAVAAALEEGISRLTFGRLAKRLAISDRIVVYYFPSKDALITAVLVEVGDRLQEGLAVAFAAPATDHLQLARSAWPHLARPEADPIFGLFFEAIGLAASGLEPYRALATRLIAAWIDWLAEFFEGSPDDRRAEAEAALALIDGLLLIRQLSGPAAADRAAARLGVA